MKFKPCDHCTTPSKCSAAGKCLKQGMSKGGMTKKSGYNKGGYCGASNPAAKPIKKAK